MKLRVLLSLVVLQSSYAAEGARAEYTQVVTNDPQHLEERFHAPCVYLAARQSFKTRFKIKDSSNVGKFMEGKEVKKQVITEGQRLLFQRIFIGLNEGEAVPSFALDTYDTVSYAAAFHTLPDFMKTFLVKKRIVTTHGCQDTAPCRQATPPQYTDPEVMPPPYTAIEDKSPLDLDAISLTFDDCFPSSTPAAPLDKDYKALYFQAT